MISRDKLAAIRVDLDAALVTIAKKHGLAKFVTGKIVYTQGGAFTAKVEGVPEGGLTKEAQRYLDLRTYTRGLPELGASIKLQGRTREAVYTIVGANTTGSKVLVNDADGKGWLYEVKYIVGRAADQKIPGSTGPDFSNVRVGAPS